MNTLYYGNNLRVLRDHVGTESVDLIYLDPPFNSKKQYSAFFKTQKGHESEAQLTAFEDTWHWGPEAEIEFQEILRQPNTDMAEMIRAFRTFLGENDMMAYLTIMANRLLELHRVLRKTGSLYLHCDPTASHYLKIVLDGIFGKENFKNEIIWKRTSAHSSAKRWGAVHDTILFYTKTQEYIWNNVFQEYSEKYLEDFYRYEDGGGRFRVGDLTGAGTTKGDSGQPWRDVNPTAVGRHWAVPTKILEKDGKDVSGWSITEKLDELDRLGLIYWPKKGRVPGFKRYYDSEAGVSIMDVITDINPLSAQAKETLPYPTQKPLSLLERIITASSNPGDTVLDPFCGCGTAVHAAQKLGRDWIGIDITCLAIALIENRLKEAFPMVGDFFTVEGTPTEIDEARDLALRDKYQFQWWACSLVNAQPYQGRKKGSDGGIDGLIFFEDSEGGIPGKVIVSVKGGESVGVTMVKDLIATVAREKAAIGLFVTLTEPTKPMITEAASAGFYESAIGKFHPAPIFYPKIQILTVEGLLHKTERADIPEFGRGVTFKKAPMEKKTPGKQEKLI